MAFEILITDDHGIVRHGTKLLIKDMLPDAIIHEAENIDQMISMLKARPYDLLILDINLPGGNSTQMMDQARLRRPDVKILIFSAYDEKLYATRYMQAGANGYLHKHTSEQEIRDAIYAILHHGRYVSPSLQSFLMDSFIQKKDQPDNPLLLLSNREIEVAELLVQGLGGIEISSSLNIQMSTVSTYKKRIYEKLNVSNVAELIEKFRLYGNGANKGEI